MSQGPVQYPIERPAIVEQAFALAGELGLDIRPEGNRPGGAGGPSCCIDAVGSLLKVLCASIDDASVGEIGTGAGVGTAWLTAGLRPGSTLTTVELDARLHAAAARLFAPFPSVTVLEGDWRDAFQSLAPFDLLFADGGGVGDVTPEGWQEVAQLVRAGGVIVMDDLTPELLWPPSWRGKPDAKRELAFRSGLFHSTEVGTGAATSALLMVRI